MPSFSKLLVSLKQQAFIASVTHVPTSTSRSMIANAYSTTLQYEISQVAIFLWRDIFSMESRAIQKWRLLVLNRVGDIPEG